MNKLQLIEAIAKGAKLTKAESERALDTFIDAVSKSLKKGGKINLVNFGVFKVVKRAPKLGRNPKTGQEVNIPSRKAVKFVPSMELKGSLNKNVPKPTPVK